MSSQRPPRIDGCYKLLLLGSSGVGKTCLSMKLAEGRCRGKYEPTVGMDFKVTILPPAKGQVLKLQVWDAPGADTWRALALSYMRSIDAVVVVIDPRAMDVVEDLKYWRSQVPCEHPLFIFANKADLKEEWKVSGDALRALGVHNMVSAKTGEQVEQAFLGIAEMLHQRIMERPDVVK